MPYLYANYNLSTSITFERSVSKHAIAFICQAAKVAQFLMQSIPSWGRWLQKQKWYMGKGRKLSTESTSDDNDFC